MGSAKYDATLQVALDKVADMGFIAGYNGAEGQSDPRLAKAVKEATDLGLWGPEIRIAYFDGVQRGKEAYGVQSQIKRLAQFLKYTDEKDK